MLGEPAARPVPAARGEWTLHACGSGPRSSRSPVPGATTPTRSSRAPRPPDSGAGRSPGGQPRSCPASPSRHPPGLSASPWLHRHRGAVKSIRVTYLQRGSSPGPSDSRGACHVTCGLAHLDFKDPQQLALLNFAPKAESGVFGGFPGDTVAKNPPARPGDTRDTGLNPGSGRSAGGGNEYLPPCLEIPMHRGAWRATPMGWQRVGQDLAQGHIIVYIIFIIYIILYFTTLH